ncbi:hypothetical protein AYI69_g9019 [Smittium culicis]|uniref:Uncharacterized protein n=1 Tax=Smittium culicis TaxID=133412 RepID=A0A1R1XFI7_9FUNG|nr:hypothetical protein AYI69_g9019 [Smittium culicis]
MAMIVHLEPFTAISQVSDHALMVSNEVCKFSAESAKTTASSANSSSGILLGIPGTSTPATPYNMSLIKKSNSIGETGHPWRTPQWYSEGSEMSSPILTAILGS